MGKEVVLTGLRSNAEFHLGNYLGAILPMVELQKKHAGQYQLNMFIPDLHSFTMPIDHGKLYEQTHQNLKVFVAAGLDIDQPDTFIYRQSYIPAHSELTWILSCFSNIGELSRMTQFKEKAQTFTEFIGTEEFNPTKGKDMTGIRRQPISSGLFIYPVLMAADILLYGAKWVPVGEDQRQHVEFTRDLAIRMNNKFGDLFIPPEDNAKQMEFAGRSEPVRIRSLRNPEKKMSKSIEDPAGTIVLSDRPEEATQKVLSATTDSAGVINYNWEKQPGIANLLQILALLSEKSQDEVNAQWVGKSSYNELKSSVAEIVNNFLADLQEKVANVNDEVMMKKLRDDEVAMSKIADGTLQRVQIAVGLRPKAPQASQ
ncbi:tryptophan--tRNA ligase [Candidatus Saccharibacteria bacterium RIFCSPHIGHO2_12_FULL_49_19]|nr:MAG: tryptophan--tRNA ligase [Candidatus Saccharibacteria bacterium RIFCSPHIGHO2_01_FULL_49_21]OGL37773.1 MAG: tryptophan--tRNA ligase [Candidatus Saccharibacteria bacterium RIFCSPHIGHO2_12_FULL_49_19]OGL38564.1 MAG: tryptophan--tRNA ligase [Candidatus Saccharibacteria bacterium RIFCSPLOWO2_01_FULL_49_22]